MKFSKFQIGDRVLTESLYQGIIIEQSRDNIVRLRYITPPLVSLSTLYREEDLTLIPTAIDKLNEIL